MSLRGVSGVVLAVVFVVVLFVANSSLVAAEPEQILEQLSMYVDCGTASVIINFVVASDNYTFVHFPNGVNLNDAHLLNAEEVYVYFTSYISALRYGFEGVSESEARANADAVTSSISSTFGVSFTWNSTETDGTEVHVTYAGLGQLNMPSFTEWTVSQCIKEDVDGFSDALPSMASQTMVSYLVLSANKESGDFDWATEITLVYASSIPTGTGSHTINALSLLGVSLLAPSPYGFDEEGVCQSIVMLNIYSTTSISFVSCEPPVITDPSERGWIYMQYLPTQLMAYFHFGSDLSPVETLTFTFSGTVVPEFSLLTLIITLLLTTCIIALRKSDKKNRSQSASIHKLW